MTLGHGLTYPSDEKAALRTLTLAQRLLPTAGWPDLTSMTRSAGQDDSFVLDLPIGGGFIAPLQVGLHHGCLKTMEQEATLLAECVRSHLEEAPIAIRRLQRIRRLSESLASAARARGAPIEFESVGIEEQTSAWGFAMGRTEVILTYPGEQMRPRAHIFAIGRLKEFRAEVMALAEVAAFRARVGAELHRLGAVAFLDPIADAAITAFGLEPLAVLQRLLDRPYAGPGMNGADFNPSWLRSTIHCRFRIGEAQWYVDHLHLRKPLPETLVAAMAGRRLHDVVEHPIFQGAIIASAISQNWGIEISIEPLPPLLLMPDGAVADMDKTDLDAVVAILATAPKRQSAI